MRTTLSPIAAAAMAALPALAISEDRRIDDIRLGLGVGVAFDQELEFAGTGFEGDVDADSLRVSLAYLRGFHEIRPWGAFFAGGEVAYEQVDGDGEDAIEGFSVDATLLSVGAQAGYAYALSAIPLHLEAALGIAYVVGTQERQDDFFPESDDEFGTGLDGFEYRARASAVFTFAAGFQVAIDLSYLIQRDLDGTVQEPNPDYEVRDSGLSAGVSLGWRL